MANHAANGARRRQNFLIITMKNGAFPVVDDVRLFEKLCLESFQSGLSWRTILAKRENFRAVFSQFDFNKVAKFTEHDVNRLLQDEGIVRHRGKIEAVINNARCLQELIKREGSFAALSGVTNLKWMNWQCHKRHQLLIFLSLYRKS